MYSNKKAQELIDMGLVVVDGRIINENIMLNESSEIKIDGEIVRKKKEYVYLKFNKPTGFESTLNTNIKNNLTDFLKVIKIYPLPVG